MLRHQAPLLLLLGLWAMALVTTVSLPQDKKEFDKKDFEKKEKDFDKKDFDKKDFDKKDFEKKDFEKKEPKKGFPFGPPNMVERKVLKQFDKDGDGRLNSDERQAARGMLSKDREGKDGFGPPKGFGPPGLGKGNREPARPGPRVNPADVKNHGDAPLYEPTILRTLFLDFENKDWEAELADFHNTDVEVPATLTVDGKKYPNVGVHFRGMSSYMGVPAGYKRSLNVEIDFVDKKQRLLGYKTLNLLNSHDDPSLLNTVLYSQISRSYLPAPKANLVKVVINGESWGVYANAQQFNKDFLAENYKTTKGSRWKVKGSPGANAGLDYLGDNVEDYKRRYTLKSGDDAIAWPALIALCKTLDQTPADKLEEALRPILDIDSLLWFLALDVALINNDGYWVRASDYNIYRDDKGRFHVIAHDINEAFRPAMGPPGGGGMFAMKPPRPGEILAPPVVESLQLSEAQKKQLAELQKELDEKLARLLTDEQRRKLTELKERGPGGFGPPGFGPPGFGPPGFGKPGGGKPDLDPLVGVTDPRKPLRSKVLAVPSLRVRYLRNLHTIADDWLDWKKLGPVVAQYRTLIEKEVEADTRKLDSLADFQRATADAPEKTPPQGRAVMSLRNFADERRSFLLNHAEIRKAAN